MGSIICGLTLEIPSLIPLCMITTTNGKTGIPLPADFRAVFESQTSKDLSWFFDDFLGTTKRLDYKIVRKENQKLLIKNKGELNAPLLLTEMTGDSISGEYWEDGFEGEKWINLPWSDNSEITIDPEHKMTELFRLNNNIRTSGIMPQS